MVQDAVGKKSTQCELLFTSTPLFFNYGKNTNDYGRSCFFSGALGHLRIRILRLPGVEGAVETVTATQPGSAPLKFDVVRFEGEVETVTFRVTQVRS